MVIVTRVIVVTCMIIVNPVIIVACMIIVFSELVAGVWIFVVGIERYLMTGIFIFTGMFIFFVVMYTPVDVGVMLVLMGFVFVGPKGNRH